jgi:hypothetical protein
MAVSDEILFTQARNQLIAATICCDNGSFNNERSVSFLILADLVSNTNTPSRVSEHFFKPISFHSKFTFSVLSKSRYPFFRAVDDAEGVFVT